MSAVASVRHLFSFRRLSVLRFRSIRSTACPSSTITPSRIAFPTSSSSRLDHCLKPCLLQNRRPDYPSPDLEPGSPRSKPSELRHAKIIGRDMHADCYSDRPVDIESTKTVNRHRRSRKESQSPVFPASSLVGPPQPRPNHRTSGLEMMTRMARQKLPTTPMTTMLQKPVER